MNNYYYIIITSVIAFLCFWWGMNFNLQPVEQGIQMTAAESCNSLIKAEANGFYDPYTGIIFVRTDGKVSENIERTLLHELGHYYNGMDEIGAENYVVKHKIIEVDLNE